MSNVTRKRIFDEKAPETRDDKHKGKRIALSKDSPEREPPTPSVAKDRLALDMFNTPPKSKSMATPSKATPRHAAKFGLTVPDASLILETINDFPVLVETVRQVVDDCGGVIDEEKLLGQLMLRAVHSFTVDLIRLESLTK